MPFVATSFFLFLGTIFSLYFANPLFFKLHFLLFILSCTTLLITLFFKISGHMIMNTAFILILNFLFGWTLLWLVLLIPLIAFARLYLKAHTKWEVLAGTIVGFSEPYLFLCKSFLYESCQINSLVCSDCLSSLNRHCSFVPLSTLPSLVL